MNGIKITPEQGALRIMYEFSDGFVNFLTNQHVTIDDDIEEDENKIESILLDIRYDVGKGDKKSSRYRTIKRILGVKDNVFGKGLNSFDIREAGSSFNPNSLIKTRITYTRNKSWAWWII